MKKRRLLAVVTAVILLLALIPQAVLADPTDPGTSDDVPSEVSDTSGTAESFTVTVACSAGGGYSVSGNDGGRPSQHQYYFFSGDTATITLKPQSGYEIASVTVGGSPVTPTDGVISFTVSSDVTVAITYSEIHIETHTVSVTVVDGSGAPVDGAVITVNGAEVSGSTDIADGTSITVAFAAKPGYELVKTKMIVGGVELNCTNPYSTDLDGDITFKAVVNEIETYNAEVTVGENGYLMINGIAVTESGTVLIPQSGETVITPVPAEGYMLSSLTVNGHEVPAGYSFTPDGDCTIEVSFEVEKVYCKITLSAGTGGSITVKDNAYEIDGRYVYVPQGESITFVFKPNVNYELNTVKVSGKTVTVTDGEYTLECTETAATVSATFKSVGGDEPTVYTITAYAGTGGSISPSGTNTVDEGDSMTFTVTASEGYEIYSVQVNGEDVTLSGGTYTFKNVSANAVISASFRKKATSDTANPITVDDIDWTTDKITIDVSVKPNIEKAVFDYAAQNFPEKNIVISDTEFTLTIPAGSGFSVSGNTVSFDFSRNGGSNFLSIQDAVSIEYPDAAFSVISCSAPTLPAGTVLDIYLGSDFSGYSLLPVSYAGGNLTVFGDAVDADGRGWVSVPYSNQTDLVLIETESDKFTLIVTYNTEGGTVDPSGTVKVASGETKTFTITPNEGYKLSSFTVDGTDMTGSAVDGVYSVVMDADHTVTVVFTAVSSGNAGLVVALVIIALAIIGGAALFVVKWRKNQF
ncbi:MAG: hypothetical protein ACI3W9_00965 [Eubacteriales bacterium]